MPQPLTPRVLLGRVDRMLQESAARRRAARRRLPTGRRLVGAAAAVAATATVLLVVFVPHHARADEFVFRTASGRSVGQATMGHSDAHNALLSLTARGLPTSRGHVFVLWASDNASSMRVGSFMVDETGGCKVRFSLPTTHRWSEFWVTQPERGASAVAST